MGIQIIRERKPSLYALFSSESDQFIAREVTRAEIVDAFVAAERERLGDSRRAHL